MKNLMIFLVLIVFNTTQAQIATPKKHGFPVKSLAMYGNKLISGSTLSMKGQLSIWDLEKYTQIFRKEMYNASFEDLVYSKNYIFTVGNSFITIFNLDGNIVTRRRTLAPSRKGLKHLILSNEGGRMIITDATNRIRIYKFNLKATYSADFLQSSKVIENEPVSDIIALDGKNRSIASEYFVTASTDKKNVSTLKVWKNLANPTIFKRIKVDEAITALAPFSDSLVLGANIAGEINVWNINTRTISRNIIKLNQKIDKIRLSHDKNILALISNTDIHIVDMLNGSILETFKGHTAQVNEVIFTRDDRLLISASEDRTIKVWKTLSNQNYIKTYVTQEMKQWQSKSEFEKTEAYIERVKKENVDKKVKEFTQKAIDKLAIRENEVVWKILQNRYDADNEVFKLKVQGLHEFYLKVPVSEAKSFSENIDKLLFTEGHFALSTNDTLALVHLLITNPKNSKTYQYNLNNTTKFEVQDVKVSIEPIDINIKTVEVAPKPEKKEAKITTPTEHLISNNLPKTKNQHPDGIAVVIGNKNYDNTKNVDFAINDAKLMKKYLIEVLGYKEGNILYVEDASLSDFKMIFGDKNMYEGQLFNMVKAQKSEVFIYYSGHGVPSLKDKQGYFVPKECNTQYVELTGYSLKTFYDNIAKIPATSTTVVLDACFSGSNIYENISPIDVKSKGILGLQKGVLFASSSGTEVSCWYNEKKQGLFTYFFLKAIHNRNADFNKDNKITFEEIQQYISDKTEGVPYYARRLHGINQNPVLQGENTQDVFVEYKK